MAAPQGLIYWGGIADFVAGRMTLTPGVAPSTCTLTIPPQDASTLFSAGPLVFRYGPATWTLTRCRLDSITAATGGDGRTRWNLQILDRRWIWQDCGRISGFYNARTGGAIRDGTEQTPRELAELCLDAMGEKRYDVSALPNDARPETDWDYTNPAEALGQLCDALGCVVVLGLDDRVRISKKGTGAALPTANIIDGSHVVDPPDPPGRLVVAGGRTRYQADFELEAVGPQPDGSIVVVNDLDYIPEEAGTRRKTWEYVDPIHFCGLTDPTHRKLAQKGVFRWYRIKTPFRLPAVAGEIRELARILPTENEQIETWEKDHVEQARPPWAYGLFYSGHESHDNTATTIDPLTDHNNTGQLYMRGFSLDTERGIVRFSEPMFQYAEDNSAPLGYNIKPADLRLRVAVNLREEDSLGWVREEFDRDPAEKSPIPDQRQYFLRDDAVREVIDLSGRRSTKPDDNLTGADQIAQYYLDAIMLDFAPRQSASITYAGLLPIALSGAVRQVSWIVDESGRAMTRASWNREESDLAPSYRESRFIARLQREIEEQSLAGRRRTENANRRRAPR